MEVMESNFIIVQHLVDTSSYKPKEGNRLSVVYDVSQYPFVAIINPLTGCVETQIYMSKYSNKAKFLDFITGFLIEDTLSSLPMIPAPSIDMQTSDRITPITPANVKPLLEKTSHSSASKQAVASDSHIKSVVPIEARDISIQRFTLI